MVGQERAGELYWMPVRCIICSKIKQPLGEAIPMDLRGMRCDDTCPGYTLDPPAAYRSPNLVDARARPVVLAGDTSMDDLGRALCEVHFGV